MSKPNLFVPAVSRHAARLAALSLSAGAVLASARPAFAFPSGNPLPGPSGLGSVPTAGTVAPGAVEAALQYERIDADGGNVDILPLATVTVGLRRGEVGAAFVREDANNSGKNNFFALHGKYVLLDSAGRSARPAQVAVGAHFYDFGSDSGFDSGSVATLYAAGSIGLGSRTQPNRLRGHLGALVQRVDEGTGGDNNTRVRPFVGLEFAATPQVRQLADFTPRSGSLQRSGHLIARYEPLGSRLSGQISIGRLGSDTKYMIGLALRFGGSAAAATAPVAPTSDAPTPDTPTPGA